MSHGYLRSTPSGKVLSGNYSNRKPGSSGEATRMRRSFTRPINIEVVIPDRFCLFCNKLLPKYNKNSLSVFKYDWCHYQHRRSWKVDQLRTKPKAWRGKRRPGL